MKMLSLFLVLCMCLIPMTVFAEEAAEAVDYIQDVPYIDDGNVDHLLDIFGVTDAEEAKPTIIEIHGGGFFGGTKETNTVHSQFYEENGFAVVTPNYTHLPAGTFITLVQEVFDVMHWVEDHAEEYHFDLNNVFLSGDSAGGFTVGLTALVISDPALQQAYGVTLPGYEIKAFVLTCPKVDVMADRELIGKDMGFPSFAAGMIQDVLLDDEVMQYADMLSLINPETYPEVYLLTTPDDAILYEEVVDFDKYLTEKGIAHEYHVYESRENTLEHVFNIHNIDWVESMEANNDIVSYLQSKMQ